MSFIDIFFIGVGLAIDASCVCTSNGMIYRPSMAKTIKLALVYAVFQGIMPLLGYFGVGLFSVKIFEYNHVVALVLLSFLGMKMIYESFGESECFKYKELTYLVILIQGITTSIDALSVGITFYNYNLDFVLYSVLLIVVITFVMCAIAVRVGIEIGVKLNSKAEIIGGLVLVGLGVKIFLESMI